MKEKVSSLIEFDYQAQKADFFSGQRGRRRRREVHLIFVLKLDPRLDTFLLLGGGLTEAQPGRQTGDEHAHPHAASEEYDAQISQCLFVTPQIDG